MNPAICVTDVANTISGARSTCSISITVPVAFQYLQFHRVNGRHIPSRSHRPRQRVTRCIQSRGNTIHLLTCHHRYGIAGLKALARSKFAQQIDLYLDSPDFPEACQEAYESTFHTDRGLRDVIIQAFRANPSLSLRHDVEMAVRETPGLAFELFRMASGLPITS
jgi:hypothetical protein